MPRFLAVVVVLSLIGLQRSDAAVINFVLDSANQKVTAVIPQPISYLITKNSIGLAVVFKGIGRANPSNDHGIPYFGNIGFSVNGGPVKLFNFEDDGYASGDVAANDPTFFRYTDVADTTALTVGDIVTINAGSMTGDTADSRVPMSGDTQTFLVAGNYLRISGDGIPTPEPAGCMVLGLTGLMLIRRPRAAA